MVRLNADIERDRKDLELYRHQTKGQTEAARQTTRLKIENVRSSIAEWEARVIEANYWIAESDRLRINVQRAQGQYDELVGIMQNVKISGKIDQKLLRYWSTPRRAELPMTRNQLHQDRWASV